MAQEQSGQELPVGLGSHCLKKKSVLLGTSALEPYYLGQWPIGSVTWASIELVETSVS